MIRYNTSQLLNNYLQDIEYHYTDRNLESLNTYTSGTPEFSYHEEVERYIADINEAIYEAESVYIMKELLVMASAMMQDELSDIFLRHMLRIGINV